MSNMSYCRFRNTLADLQDCAEALDDYDSLDRIDCDHERLAAKQLIKLCSRVVDEWLGRASL